MAESTGGTSRAKRLPKRTADAVRARREAERASLIDQITRLDRESSDESWKEPRSDDDAETGSAFFERERTMSLARNARHLLAQVDGALQRLEQGTYGACRSCGETIPAERLEALPQAVHCLDCQRQAERTLR